MICVSIGYATWLMFAVTSSQSDYPTIRFLKRTWIPENIGDHHSNDGVRNVRSRKHDFVGASWVFVAEFFEGVTESREELGAS